MSYLLEMFAATQISPGNLPQRGAGENEVQLILNIIFSILGALAFLIMVISGLRYIVAAGDPQKTSQARNSIIFALVGLAIAVTAQAVVAFVVNRL